MVAAAGARALSVAVCTIYDANFEPPTGRLVTAALGLFNDAITRNAHAAGLDLVDLRLICDERGDYANPIEPSARAGAKIAGLVREVVTGHDFARGVTSFYPAAR